MTRIWMLEGAGYWFALALPSLLAVAVMMTVNHPAAAFAAFSVSMILLLALFSGLLSALSGADAGSVAKEDRQSGNVFGFLLGLVLSVAVFGPAVYLVFR